jgi:hypothetical protein
MSVTTTGRAAKKPRSNTAPHAMPGTGTSMAAPRGGPRSEFADDPFIRRLAADPAQSERDQQSRRDIVEGLKILENQRKKLTIADEYYDGEVGMVYASQQVRRLLTKQGVTDADIQDFNYARIPVDAISEKLQIAAVKVAPLVDDEDDEDGEATADPKTLKRAEKAIKTIRKNNRLDVYEKHLHKTMCKHGSAYLFLWPVTATSGRNANKVVSVDFRVNDGHTVAFVYDPEDPLRVAYVIKSWETPSEFPDVDEGPHEPRRPVIRANLYYPGEQQIDSDGVITQGMGRIERWVTKPGANATHPSSWVRVSQLGNDVDIDEDDLQQVAADEFGDPDSPLDKDDIPSPFGLTWFEYRNDVPCGRPEHEAAYGPQALINKLVWSYAGNVEYQGFPQRYLMVDPAVDDPMVNNIDPNHPEDDDDDPESETSTSGLRSDPGSVWKMYGKSTGQYSAADPDTFLKPLDRFIKSMAELTDVPAYKFTKSSGDMPSGEAFREANASYYSKVRDRQDRADPEWQDAYELALRMMGVEGVAVDVRWVPVAPVNDLNGLNVLKAKGELGVPSEVLLNEAGYPDDQVDQWIKRQDGLSLPQRVALLGQVATAITGIAPGVTAGIVPDNMTQALIARLFGNLAEGTQDAPASPDALPAPTFRDPPPVLPPGGMLGGPSAPGGGRPPAKKAAAGGPGRGAQGPGRGAAKKTTKATKATKPAAAAPAAKRPVKKAAPAATRPAGGGA